MTSLISARIRVLRAPVRDGIAMSFAPLRHRTMVLVSLSDTDGRTGHGESWVNYPSWAPVERVATLREGVLPLLAGREVDDVSAVHAELCQHLDPLGRQWGAIGPVRQAISAVDVALWDLAAQRAGTAIAGVAGRRMQDSLPVYASSVGPEDVAERSKQCLYDGHRALKVKLGFGRETDTRNLAEAREAIGADAVLYADANQGWDVEEAVAMAPVLRESGVAWIEEPVRGDQLADLEELHRRTGLVIATGENVYGRRAFAALAASPAVTILQPDVAKAGGITETLAVCDLAAASDTAVFPHLYGGAAAFGATLQVAAASPAVQGLEYDIRDNPLRDGLLVDPPTPHAGRIDLPDRPGLGIHLNEDALDRFTHDDQTWEPS
ncbi:L-alanine-DL-glutamate epimerase-like enolase superfamily enzyme [Nocardioides albertanoniae]|uniref:L-alanine-DL-glutamate epimerase-like enolase superfamily enzyme n=1 Tax=Nocardioides albertanoniae TaxID=1175486 RepID=A0A543A1K4_9ACTN|nr:mandelate racemase/muconate lactonizing enzyme family protein [Nocardioides albertanoniae]TQL66396.1 L-alanine-DL-glutamate epimerase-like enolase superfamily enzyme [Nocardioides albertanoniae]